jgi:hypothetical protein
MQNRARDGLRTELDIIMCQQKPQDKNQKHQQQKPLRLQYMCILIIMLIMGLQIVMHPVRTRNCHEHKAYPLYNPPTTLQSKNYLYFVNENLRVRQVL